MWVTTPNSMSSLRSCIKICQTWSPNKSKSFCTSRNCASTMKPRIRQSMQDTEKVFSESCILSLTYVAYISMLKRYLGNTFSESSYHTIFMHCLANILLILTLFWIRFFIAEGRSYLLDSPINLLENILSILPLFGIRFLL